LEEGRKGNTREPPTKNNQKEQPGEEKASDRGHEKRKKGNQKIRPNVSEKGKGPKPNPNRKKRKKEKQVKLREVPFSDKA